MTALATWNSDCRPVCMSDATAKKIEAIQWKYFPPGAGKCLDPDSFREQLTALLADRGDNEIGYYLPLSWIKELGITNPISYGKD